MHFSALFTAATLASSACAMYMPAAERAAAANAAAAYEGPAPIPNIYVIQAPNHDNVGPPGGPGPRDAAAKYKLQDRVFLKTFMKDIGAFINSQYAAVDYTRESPYNSVVQSCAKFAHASQYTGSFAVVELPTLYRCTAWGEIRGPMSMFSWFDTEAVGSRQETPVKTDLYLLDGEGQLGDVQQLEEAQIYEHKTSMWQDFKDGVKVLGYGLLCLGDATLGHHHHHCHRRHH